MRIRYNPVRQTTGRTLSTLLLLSMALTGVAPQAADLDSRVPARVVRFGDLDLHSTDGIGRLYARLSRAAREVCVAQESADLMGRARWNRCVDQALAQGVAAVGNPALRDYYVARGGKAPVAPTVADVSRFSGARL